MGNTSSTARGLVVAGSGSGAGKTTVSLALMAALRRRGLVVQACKVGPDFIDPGHHAVVTGRPAHNLDSWMLAPAENRAILARAAVDADVVVVEGVMGLYDGYDAVDEAGSTAHMAKLLGLPVLLVAGARSLARSFAALVRGYVEFDPGLAWAGVAANQVGGPGHAEILRRAMTQAPGADLLGCLPRDESLALAERHLGLITAQEGGLDARTQARLADWLEGALDLDRLLARLPRLELAAPEPPPEPVQRRVRLGVARDEAFCFYYPENLRRLAEAGAELVEFSPLRGNAPPAGLAGLYLGGGYPELHAEALAGNEPMRAAIASLGRAGLPIYAECGGMMYLGSELLDPAGRRWPMAGLLPLTCRMLPRLRALGYRQVELRRACLLGQAGAAARGHEFHYSEIAALGQAEGLRTDLYAAQGRQGRADVLGLGLANTVASYAHLHFGSNPALAPALVAACCQWERNHA